MIFGIGLSRTGTTSLHHALELLGYRSAPSSAALLDDQYDRLLDRYDAFTDNPIPFMYRDLDARYPGSKFILTTRPLAGWLASMEWLFDEGLLRLDRRTRRQGRRMHRQLYGLRHFRPERLSEIYRSHHDGVDEFFKHRPDDLLRMDLGELANRWEPLCEFLGVKEPLEPFPYSNGRGDRLPARSVRD